MSLRSEVLEQVQIDTNVEHQHVAFCDAHDLLAIINAGEDSEAAVTVYRLKGEIAFTVSLRDDEDLRPLSMRWKPDGTLLAVNWSDQVCCLYSGENGKLLYELPTRRVKQGYDGSWTLDVNLQEPVGGVDASELDVEDAASSAPVIWTSYDEGRGKRKGGQRNGEDSTTDDFFDRLDGEPVNGTTNSAGRSDSPISDLVNAITTLDTTTVMPRLGKIETSTGVRHSPESNKFSTQASTDTIFDASAFAPGIFSTLLASDTKGCVTVFVDETIKVGHVQLSHSHQLKTASHPECQSQVVLTRDEEGSHGYQLDFIDLPLDRLGSSLNYIVSLNTRRLQSLMAYITHTIRCVHQEIQTGIKGVPTRLMKLLEEDLQSAAAESTLHSGAEPTTNTAINELQHIALTSNFHPVVLEWLKDIVKETGHKRWDQATNAMYDHIQSYLFKNLLPALQRFVAAVSALRGQARWHQHTGKFAVKLDVFEQLLQWADTLSIVAQRTLHVVTEQHAQFEAFSKWLRVMIDVAVAGPGSKSADETEEREAPNYDVDLVLRYLRGPLMGSLLKVLAESAPAVKGMLAREAFFEHEVVRSLSREGTIAALEMLESGSEGVFDGLSTRHDVQPQSRDAVNLPLLTCLLKAHTRLAIEEINDWQAQAVPRAPDVVSLGDASPSPDLGKVYDMVIYPTPSPTTNRTVTKEEETLSILADSNSESEPPSLAVVQVARRRDAPPGTPSPHPVSIQTLDIPPTTPSSATEPSSHTEASHVIVVHAAFLPFPTATKATTNALTNTGEAQRPQALILTRTSEEGDDATEHALILLTTTSPSNDSASRTSRILHTWPSSSPTSPSPPSFLPSPTHFTIGGRPGKRVVVVFSPATTGGASGGHGRIKGTKWEVLDLERMVEADGGEGDDGMEE